MLILTLALFVATTYLSFDALLDWAKGKRKDRSVLKTYYRVFK